jgi:site-specific DNA-methyltransferase (adenine-specific)
MAKGSFYVGDVADGCPDIRALSCDLSITSPPYFRRNGYSDQLMRTLGRIYARALKPGCRAYVIVGQIKEKLDRPFDVQREILAGGGKKLVPGQTIIWVKSIAVGGWVEQCPSCSHKYRSETVSRGHFQPINSKHLLNYCWEYVLSFIKSPEKEAHPLNRKGIGVPYADKTNVTRWKSAADAVHCPGDIWFIPYETTGSTVKKVHRHEFPLELARRLIVGSGIPRGSTVFDPFVGGGTTCFAANNCGMDSCGYDLNKNTIDALRRVWTSGINGRPNH